MKPVSLSVLALASQAIATQDIRRRWSNEDNAWSSSLANYLSSFAKGTATAKTVGPIRTFTQYDTITTAKTVCNSRSVCSLSQYATSANPRVFTETAYVSQIITSCSGGNCLVATASESVLPVTTTVTTTQYYATASTQCNSKSTCSAVPTTRTSVITTKITYTPSLPPVVGVTGSTIKITPRQNAASSTTMRSSTSTTKPTSTTFSSSSTKPLSTSSSSTTRTTVATSTTRGSSTVDANLATTSTSKTTTTTPKPTTTTTTSKTTTKTTTTTTTAKNAVKTFDVTGLTYQNAMLTVHNFHRTNHSLPALVWNQDLANTAQHIADSCKYGHNVTADGGGYGQNIGAGAAGNAAAGLITNLMYNGEIGYYPLPYGDDNPSLDNFHLWGHYSQLVWSDTTDVGCVTKYCPNGLANTGPGVAPYFTVCNYSPPGNYVGEFSSVAAPGGGQTVVVVGS